MTPTRRAISASLFVWAHMLCACGGEEASPSPTLAVTPTPAAPTDPPVTAPPETATPPAPTEVPTQPPSPTSAPTPTPGPLILGIRGLVPSDGAMAIPRFPSVQVVFSQDLPEGAEAQLSARLISEAGTTIPLQIDTASEQAGDATLALLPTAALSASTRYEVEVELAEVEGFAPQGGGWPLTATSSFETTVPCGVSFNIVNAVQIVELGDNPALVNLLQEILDSSTLAPVALMAVDVFTSDIFPLDGVRLVSGLPVRGSAPGIYAVDPVYGFPVSVPECDITSEGELTCEEATFVFPIPITDDSVLYLTISQAQLSGEASASGAFTDLNNFLLSGVVTEEDLLDTLAAIGMESLAELIKLDVDTDADGVPDAATAIAASDPIWLDFEHCDESGGGAAQ